MKVSLKKENMKVETNRKTYNLDDITHKYKGIVPLSI